MTIYYYNIYSYPFDTTLNKLIENNVNCIYFSLNNLDI